jgi:hypothetical protein
MGRRSPEAGVSGAGHSKVNLAMDVHDRATVEELRGVMPLNPIKPNTQDAA